jgi:conjugal transfer pilus assembly protein TraE
MHKRLYDSDLDQSQADARRWQRLALIVAVADLLLTGRIALMSSHEKVIITPPTIAQSFWVKGSKVSPSYLEQMAQYYAGLMLTFSPDSLRSQKDVVLRFTDPAYHGALDAQLTADIDRVTRDRISEVFYAANTRVRLDALEVAISGDLIIDVGSQQASVKHPTYVIRFSNRDGQLFVASFTESQHENDPFGDRGSPTAAAADAAQP